MKKKKPKVGRLKVPCPKIIKSKKDYTRKKKEKLDEEKRNNTTCR